MLAVCASAFDTAQLREAVGAIITVMDRGGPSRPVNNAFRDTLVISTAAGGPETRAIIVGRPEVATEATKAKFLDDLISGRIMGQAAFRNVTSLGAVGAKETVRATPAGLFISRLQINTGAGGAAPEKDPIQYEPVEFAAPPTLLFGTGLLSFNENGDSDNTILGTGGVATLVIGGPTGVAVMASVDTMDKSAIAVLNELAADLKGTLFTSLVVGNELDIGDVALDNSISFSGTDPTFQYGEFISAAVPEPPSFMIWCTAMALLGLYELRRQKLFDPH